MSWTCRCTKCTRIAARVANTLGHPSNGNRLMPSFVGEFSLYNLGPPIRMGVPEVPLCCGLPMSSHQLFCVTRQCKDCTVVSVNEHLIGILLSQGFFLNYECIEEVWFIYGDAFWKYMGLIVHTLYGMKSSGEAWRLHLYQKMAEIRFRTCRTDTDVWIHTKIGNMDLSIGSMYFFMWMMCYQCLTSWRSS